MSSFLPPLLSADQKTKYALPQTDLRVLISLLVANDAHQKSGSPCNSSAAELMRAATNAVTILLLMCWEGGWEWARRTVALDERGLDSYSYSYSYPYSLLIYTPGRGGPDVKGATPPFMLILV